MEILKKICGVYIKVSFELTPGNGQSSPYELPPCEDVDALDESNPGSPRNQNIEHSYTNLILREANNSVTNSSLRFNFSQKDLIF